MFMGEYNHSVDNKGRLIVPAKFREQLGEGFVVTKGMDHCLWLFAAPEWQKLVDKIQALPVTSTNGRNVSRFFLAGATECEVDKQGRILIPAPLRKHANLDKDVALVGVGNRIEIWDQDAWMNASDIDLDSMTEELEGLGI